MKLTAACKFKQRFDLWKSDNIFFYFLALVAILCSEAELQAIYTTRVGTDLSCENSSNSLLQFDLCKSDKKFLFLALAAILCSEADMSAKCTTRVGTVHFSLVWSKPPAVWPVKAEQGFSILSSGVQFLQWGNMHN
jgi:hypothetical protein